MDSLYQVCSLGNTFCYNCTKVALDNIRSAVCGNLHTAGINPDSIDGLSNSLSMNGPWVRYRVGQILPAEFWAE